MNITSNYLAFLEFTFKGYIPRAICICPCIVQNIYMNTVYSYSHDLKVRTYSLRPGYTTRKNSVYAICYI